MRTFYENLNAYHALNAIGELHSAIRRGDLKEAKTIEEIDTLLEEERKYWETQRKEYSVLGEEMVKIMSKHWWEFWK